MDHQSSDLQLIQLWMAGNDEAGNQIVRTYYPRLFGSVKYELGKKMFGDIDPLVTEICQDAFKRVFEDAYKFQGGSFFNWIRKYAEYLTLEKLNQKKKEGERFLKLVPNQDAADNEREPLAKIASKETDPVFGNPECIYIQKEESEIVRTVLNSLKSEHRYILVQRLIIGLKYTEISRATGKSENALKLLYSRAVESFRKEYCRQTSIHPSGIQSQNQINM